MNLLTQLIRTFIDWNCERKKKTYRVSFWQNLPLTVSTSIKTQPMRVGDGILKRTFESLLERFTRKKMFFLKLQKSADRNKSQTSLLRI